MEDRDLGYSGIMGLLEDLKRSDKHVAIGVLDGSGEIPEGGISMAGLATVHEFGAMAGPGRRVKIPERAPIRKTLDEQSGQISLASGRMLTRVVAGDETVDSALGKIGQFVTSQIRRTIQRGVDPPNASSTIVRKKSSKPLIDEGLLLRAYDYQVREGD